ncbi:MAG: U32 family peptidase [Clostridia bacterium]|nr:U32 family peptidase [Clostridia bacterium]
MVELLSPVGDFDCLKAAVQNGADCVYFGSNMFSARASATNFDINNLEKAIQYAKLRGVRTNLTLNTLIKNNEFEAAYNLAKSAYEFGIDAIIVQDLGLGMKLINDFPDLPIHASTQMSAHNLQGVLELEKLGFKRVVLARELSAEEIEYICKNTNVEIECFIHGALCICYSGQCLFSSMVGGRSGNRGKCAQPCRLPYSLVDDNNSTLDSGYILSPKDLYGLEFLPQLIKCGVTSFKIEGRMKTPEYVATITRIYRKYINLANSLLKENSQSIDNTDKTAYKIDEQDKKALLQVFNRGLSSTGHLDKEPNQNLIYKDKPNNMGLPLGIVQKFNNNKGYITLKLKENISVGDTVSLENETGTYTISELMKNDKNITLGKTGDIVTIGRMKGNINVKDNVYKMSSKELTKTALDSLDKENKKILLNAKITIKKGNPLSILITSANNYDIYNDLNLTCSLDEVPVDAQNRPLTKETVIEKINKTGNTFFEFARIDVDLDENCFIPSLSLLNELRRKSLEAVENFGLSRITRKANESSFNSVCTSSANLQSKNQTPKISLLLNVLNTSLDYTRIENIDKLYIPLKYFANKKYSFILKSLSEKFKLYIYLPTIIKANYRNMFLNNIENSVTDYNIKGIVLSNISNFVLLENLLNNKKLELIANYTFNIYNNETINELKKLGISCYTVSPELDKESIINLGVQNCTNKSSCSQDNATFQKEAIVYGRIPLMNSNYCLLGKTNKCYPKCDAKCNNFENHYYLKDRKNMLFPIVPDNVQTVTTIYNCKTLSILPNELNIDFARIDVLYENIDEINRIIEIVRSNKRFEGNNFTNGNLNREI